MARRVSAAASTTWWATETGSLPGGNGNRFSVTNPGLGLLGCNGGPTETIALLAGSPAIDAGSKALALDQNGVHSVTDQPARATPGPSMGSVDIGAFERSGDDRRRRRCIRSMRRPPRVPGRGTTGDLVYVIEQADANANLAGSIIEFDPTVFGTSQTITLSSTLELAEPSGPMVIEGPGRAW